MIAASVSVTVSPANGRRPVNISQNTTPNAQTSDRLSTGRPRACSGLIYAAVPRITPCTVIAGDIIVGEFIRSAFDPLASNVFASPKSRILIWPSAATITLAGFRSRWTMPFSCAASRPSAICRAIEMTSGSSSGRPSASIASQRAARHVFHDERGRAVQLLEAVDVRDVMMAEGGERLRLAIESREPIRIAGELIGQDLDRDVAIEASVMREIDAPIPPSPSCLTISSEPTRVPGSRDMGWGNYTVKGVALTTSGSAGSSHLGRRYNGACSSPISCTLRVSAVI